MATHPHLPREGYPRTVAHLGGDLVLDRRPERIVTSSNFAGLEPLLALGVQPVAHGIRPASELASWVADALEPGGFAFDFATPRLERIAAAEPDLMLDDDRLWFVVPYAGKAGRDGPTSSSRARCSSSSRSSAKAVTVE